VVVTVVGSVEQAAAALEAGRLVAVPTDTVYGLLVDARRPRAAAALAGAKGRDEAVPVQVLVADVDQALELCGADGLGVAGARLARRFWPGGLTVVVPRRPEVALDLGADGRTVGLRCPDHPVPRTLCRRVGPVAATSANVHGEPPLTTAAAVAAVFDGVVDVVVDGGLGGQTASTVVSLADGEPVLLREGAVPWDQVLATIAGTDG
jgi:L-threonylcarbamoyladenylate synthase